MKRYAPIIASLVVLSAACEARAGTVLDRVRRDRVVRCDTETRTGLAAAGPDGDAVGAGVDLCRAIARAVLGPDGRIAFSLEEPSVASDGGSSLGADVAFVAREDDAAPAVFVDPLAVLVPVASRVRRLSDLGGETICLMIGSPEQSALEAFARRSGTDITRLAFEEDVEMRDAYAVGRCGAMVGAESALSGLRRPTGVNRLASRLLPETLGKLSIVATTPAGDRAWADVVAKVARRMSDSRE